jgi:predicted MFS family arabinose efflux permease
MSGGLILIGQDHSLLSYILTAVGVLLIPAFVAWEHHHPQPVVDFSLFISRTFSASNIMTLFFYGALGGLFFELAQHLISDVKYSPQKAGAATVPISICLALFSSRIGKLAQNRGPRMFMTFGPLMCAVGTIYLYSIHHGTKYWTGIFPGIVIFGLGLATLVAPLTATVMASVDDERAGLASGINNAVSRLAGSLVIATIGLFTASSTYHGTIILCVALMIAAGIVSFIGISPKVLEH